MADEKQMNAVQFFCKHPVSDDGSKKLKGMSYHNWADLVQRCGANPRNNWSGLVDTRSTMALTDRGPEHGRNGLAVSAP